MARDESTEGWLPLQGGGLAKVSIRKRSRLSPEVKGHEYIIYGQRISDQTVSGEKIDLSKSHFYTHAFSGDFKLCDQQGTFVQQSYANISSLAYGQTEEWINISDSCRCPRF